jgi:hypothetical protein
VDSQGQERSGRLLDKTAFPQCLIRESWDKSRDMELVADYIRWQAPLLLQLPYLETDVRKKLEILARQALERVAQFHNLYPEIIDRQQINAALVEARMKEAQKG